jgi:hypothetical protein
MRLFGMTEQENNLTKVHDLLLVCRAGAGDASLTRDMMTMRTMPCCVRRYRAAAEGCRSLEEMK